MRPIVGLVSSYDEGLLLRDAVATLAECCDRIFVLEGPIGEQSKPTQPFPKLAPRATLRRSGPYASDAAKRTELVKWAQERVPGPAWALTLDGDEILWAARFLPAYLARLEEEQDGAMKIKLVEAGDEVTVWESGVRILPLEKIEAFTFSGYEILLKGSTLPIQLPLTPATRAPAYHEPHIVHRAYLRAGDRRKYRLNHEEQAELEKLGLVFPEKKPLVVVR